MAKTTKKSKTGKSKAKLALGITVAIMALFAVGYFVYFSGIVPQLLPGMTITETKADGTTAKVADLSVLETNYYYMSIYSMYAQYGMINSDNLDKVVNESTGQTYRELLLSQGADEAVNLILMEREAESKGFRHSFHRLPDAQRWSSRASAAWQSFTATTLLTDTLPLSTAQA